MGDGVIPTIILYLYYPIQKLRSSFNTKSIWKWTRNLPLALDLSIRLLKKIIIIIEPCTLSSVWKWSIIIRRQIIIFSVRNNDDHHRNRWTLPSHSWSMIDWSISKAYGCVCVWWCARDVRACAFSSNDSKFKSISHPKAKAFCFINRDRVLTYAIINLNHHFYCEDEYVVVGWRSHWVENSFYLCKFYN